MCKHVPMLVVLLAALCVPALRTQAAEEAKVAEISLEDLKKAVAEKKVTLLDCLGAESFAKAHIPGALDFRALKTDLSKNLPADKGSLIVAYCYNEQCPAYKEGAETALKLGYTNVKHFPGGIVGWTKAGEKTEAGK